MLSAQVSHLQRSTGSLPCTVAFLEGGRIREAGAQSPPGKGIGSKLKLSGPFLPDLIPYGQGAAVSVAFSLLESMGSGSHPLSFLSPD